MIGGSGIFLMVVKENLAERDFGEAVGLVFSHGGVDIVEILEVGGVGEIGVEVIFVVISGEGFELAFDGLFRAEEK